MKVAEKGSIVAIHLCTGYRRPMRSVESAVAIADYGLQGDWHARGGSRRQVLLIDAETLAALKLLPGAVRENITTRSINLTTLKAGQRVRLGGEVRLEITKPCTPCQRMEEVRAGLQSELAGRRGMLARVVSGGLIQVGDTVQAEDHLAEAGVTEVPFADPVVIPIEDFIDLHTFSPKETRSLVEEYINECHRRGMMEVRIIHGRGLGVQREIVRSVLQRLPQVASFYDAPPDAGGWGATVVRMKDDCAEGAKQSCDCDAPRGR